MFGSEILDVVIGMIFIFLLLSLICSAVNEMIEAALNKRAKLLEKGIKELLNDQSPTGLVAELYKHPLIAGLFRGSYGANASLPSYIPARNFSLALMDVVLPGVNASQSGTANATTPANAANITMTRSGATSPLQPLRDAIDTNQVINSEVKKALMTLIDAAGDDPAKARENIENWFNSSMDRVSGWYKRRAQVIILVLGLLTAIGINADSITISNSLSHDKALRDSLTASAQEYAKIDASTAASASGSQDLQSGIEDCRKDAESPECKYKTSLRRIENLGLPIGWDRSNPKLVPTDAGGWLLKIFGWLITAFAISLGAPFWFDLLNKFMVVRSTVKPREKSPEEPSKA